MKPKKKCKIEYCNGLCWSKQLCKFHYSLEFPQKPIKKKPISKKPTTRALQKKEEKREYTELQDILFEKHWNSKPHYCESCNRWLGTENNKCFHDHLLEKGNPKYEHLALEINNLYLVCFDCHGAKTNGFPTEKHKLAIENAKVLFKIV